MFGKSKTQRFVLPKGVTLGPGEYDTDRAENALKSKAYQSLPKSAAQRFAEEHGRENLGPGAYNVEQAKVDASSVIKTKEAVPRRPRESLAPVEFQVPGAAESQEERQRKLARQALAERDELRLKNKQLSESRSELKLKNKQLSEQLKNLQRDKDAAQKEVSEVRDSLQSVIVHYKNDMMRTCAASVGAQRLIALLERETRAQTEIAVNAEEEFKKALLGQEDSFAQQLHDLNTTVYESRHERDTLRSKLSAAEDKFSANNLRLEMAVKIESSLREELSRVENELKHSKSLESGLRESVAGAMQSIAELQNQLEWISESRNCALQELQTLEKAFEEAEAIKESLLKDSAQCEKQVEDMELEKSKVTTLLELRESELQTEKMSRKSLEDALEFASNETRRIEELVSAKDQKISELEKLNMELCALVTARETELQAETATAQCTAQELRTLEMELETTSEERIKLAEQLGDTEVKIGQQQILNEELRTLLHATEAALKAKVEVESDLSRRFDEVALENDKLLALCQVVTEEKAVAMEHGAELKSQLVSAENEIKVEKEALKLMKAEVERFRNDLTALIAEKVALEVQLESSNSKVVEMQEQEIKHVARLEAREYELEAERNSRSTIAQNNRKKMEIIEGEKQYLTSLVKENEEKLADLQEENSHFLALVSARESEVSKLRAFINETLIQSKLIQSDFDEAQSKLCEADRQLKEKDAMLQHFVLALQVASKELVQLRRTSKSLKDDFVEHSGKLQYEAENKIQSLVTLIDDLQCKLEREGERLRIAEEKIDTSEIALVKVESSARISAKIIEDMRSTISDKEKKLQDQSAELQNIETLLQESSTQNKTLQVEILKEKKAREYVERERMAVWKGMEDFKKHFSATLDLLDNRWGVTRLHEFERRIERAATTLREEKIRWFKREEKREYETSTLRLQVEDSEKQRAGLCKMVEDLEHSLLLSEENGQRHAQQVEKTLGAEIEVLSKAVHRSKQVVEKFAEVENQARCTTKELELSKKREETMRGVIRQYEVQLMENNLLRKDEIFSKDSELAATRAEQERAREEMSRLAAEAGHLAGHQNHKQKIQHLVKVKQENVELKLKVARLEARLKKFAEGEL